MKKGVMRPGHVQIRVLDMEDAVVHYSDRLGLIEVKRDGQNRAYFKGWTEIDAYSVILREADEPGMDFMGFKVDGPDTLAALKQGLVEYGCNVESIPAGELEGCGERVRFDSPTGHYFELYAEKEQTGKWGLNERNPEAWPEGLKGMKATRFDHCLLYGDDIDGTVELFEKALGFQLSEQVLDSENDNLRVAAFLSCSMKAHDVALVRHPEKGKFHHASFYLNTWEDVLRAADLIAMHDISLDIGPTRHGLTHGQTIYFFDPSGNRNEVFAGGDYTYPDHPVVTWDAEQLGKAIFYHDRKLNENFLGVVT
jgi:catechol 2,3-dioxygenase